MPLFSSAIFNSAVFNTGGAAVTPPQPGGGSGKRYPVGNLDLETWRRKHRKLKVRVEKVQEQIQQVREEIDLAPTLERAEKLKRRIAELQKLLLKLLGDLDEARKMNDMAEEEEVLAIYFAYRTIH